MTSLHTAAGLSTLLRYRCSAESKLTSSSSSSPSTSSSWGRVSTGPASGDSACIRATRGLSLLPRGANDTAQHGGLAYTVAMERCVCTSNTNCNFYKPLERKSHTALQLLPEVNSVTCAKRTPQSYSNGEGWTTAAPVAGEDLLQRGGGSS